MKFLKIYLRWLWDRKSQACILLRHILFSTTGEIS